MEPSSLEVGRTYYRTTWADADRTMPDVRPMVYVGCNILEDDDDETLTYYFQDTVSVVRFGLVGSSENSGQLSTCESNVFSFGPDELGVSIIDLKDVGELVELAFERSEALGFPTLKKLGGDWS